MLGYQLKAADNPAIENKLVGSFVLSLPDVKPFWTFEGSFS